MYGYVSATFDNCIKAKPPQVEIYIHDSDNRSILRDANFLGKDGNVHKRSNSVRESCVQVMQLDRDFVLLFLWPSFAEKNREKSSLLAGRSGPACLD